MNEHDISRQEALRESWIESLLVSATRPQDHVDRVALAMSQIETEPVATHETGPTRKPARSARWGAIAVAAALLLALFLVFQNGNSSRSALAAVQRSLNVAAQQTTRKYLLQIEYRPAIGGTRKTDSDLYVQGNDRFALRHPGLLPGTSFWCGQNGTDSWVVPAFGPVRKGDNTLLSRWLRSREQLDTPYLHVTTVLTRMSSGYQLETLDDEEITIPGGDTVPCQHIRAQLKTPDQSNLPDTIELWASRESAMAIRLLARWKLADGEIGRESIALTFQSEGPSLSDDWFTAEGHFEGRRPIMRGDTQEK